MEISCKNNINSNKILYRRAQRHNERRVRIEIRELFFFEFEIACCLGNIKIIGILLFVLLPLIISCKGNPKDDFQFKKIRIDEYNEIIIEEKDSAKYIYTKFKNRNHGIFFKYNQNNQIIKKEIYYMDTLLQGKAYFWKNDQIDSIVSYIYRYEDAVAKPYLTCIYPSDTVFFNVRYKIFDYDEQPTYKIELVGDGAIGVMSVSDSIYTSNQVNNSKDKMNLVKKYFVYKCSDYNYNNYAQSYFLFLKRSDGYLTLSRQILLYHVPILAQTENLKRFRNYEILY